MEQYKIHSFSLDDPNTKVPVSSVCDCLRAIGVVGTSQALLFYILTGSFLLNNNSLNFSSKLTENIRLPGILRVSCATLQVITVKI